MPSHLHASEGIDRIEVGPYLTTLCASLSASVIGDAKPVMLKVAADGGQLGSAEAVSIGLIVTELVINALKYAFPNRRNGEVLVTFDSNAADWKLVVSDNGVGKADALAQTKGGGLGTVIVRDLVKHLNAQIETASTEAGLRVSVTRATFPARAPLTMH